MKLTLRWLLQFVVLVAILDSRLYVCGDDDDDDDDDDHPSSGGGSSSSGNSDCSWTGPGGRTYDLSDMVRGKKDDDWKAEEDIQGFKFDYYFNICGNSNKGCNNHDTAASQYQIFGGTSAGCIPLGESWDNGKKNAEWSEFGKPESDPKGSGVILKYKNGQVCSTGGEKFSLALKIPCGDTKRDRSKKNDGLDPKKFVVEQDSASGCEYTITFPAIEEGCPSSGGGDWGWVFIGLFITTLGLYFGIGITFRVKKLGYTGMEAIPHLEFWESLPGLVLDGIRFAIDQTKQAIERFRENR